MTYPWKVIGVLPEVHDQRITAGGFVYTVGLHQLFDLPELWCSIEATDGGYASMEDMTAVVNNFAERMTEGDLGSGSVVEENGYRFALGEPLRELRAIGALMASHQQGNVTIIPVSWGPLEEATDA